ncbi:MAG: hypothetical protein ACPG6R_11025 [Aequoribacter sp.]|uniref:hypothetical protein n=1 Tax=Aequoribacter sp. TaxID=2847771 RepID=UPI003C47BFAC
MSERLMFIAELEAGGFNAAADEMRAKVAASGRAVAGTADIQDKFAKSTDKTRSAIGGAATALSGLSGAAGGAGGEVAALTGAVDNLGSAMAGGGPLALGIVATVGLLGVLVEHYSGAAEAAQESARIQAQAMNAAADAISKEIKDVNTRIDAALGITEIDKKISKLRATLGALRAIARADVADVAKVLIDRGEDPLDAIKAAGDQIASAKSKVDDYSAALIKANGLKLVLDADTAKLKEIEDRLARLRTGKKDPLVVDAEDLLPPLQASRETQDEFFLQNRARSHAKFAQEQADIQRTAMEIEEQHHQFRLQQIDSDARKEVEIEKKKQAEIKKARDLSLKEEEARQKMQADIVAANQQRAADAAVFAADIGARAVEDLLVGALTNQQDLLLKSIEAIAIQTGTYIAGIGLGMIASGSAKLFGPPGAQAIGAAEIAKGGAWLALGSGLGVGGRLAGVAVSKNAQARQDEIDDITGDTDERARLAGSVSSGSLGARVEGGGQVVHNFVFNGPAVANDQAGRWLNDQIKMARGVTLRPTR